MFSLTWIFDSFSWAVEGLEDGITYLILKFDGAKLSWRVFVAASQCLAALLLVFELGPDFAQLPGRISKLVIDYIIDTPIESIFALLFNYLMKALQSMVG